MLAGGAGENEGKSAYFGKKAYLCIFISNSLFIETMGRFPIFDAEAVLYSNSLMKIGIFLGTAAVSVV